MAAKQLSGTWLALRKWAHKASGFNKYGLYRDDLLMETPEVLEAVRRLPPHIVDERNYRLYRAAQLSLTKTILPKEEWITFEQERANRYLSPYLKQVIKEWKEKEEWNANH